MTDDIFFESALGIARRMAHREISPVELTEAMLARIDEIDGQVHSYLTVMGDSALAEAHASEQAILSGGPARPLEGVPVAVKDMCDTAGARTTSGSKAFDQRVPDADATVVKRLRDAGAVILGKLSMTDFAFSMYSETVTPVLNPWGSEPRWSGASSSGSGAAVAAGLSYLAVATDTAGSVRVPASINGVVGIKPTWGLVSTHGVFPLAPSMDFVGPIARSVDDAALMLGVMAGHDPRDPSSLRLPPQDYLQGIDRGLDGLRVAIDRRHSSEGIDPEIRDAVFAAATLLAANGATVRDVTLPDLGEALADYWVTIASEAAVTHADVYPTHKADYSFAIRALVEEGMGISAQQYIRAQGSRRRLAAGVADVFEDIDVLLAPSWPSGPPSLNMALPPITRLDPSLFGERVRCTAPYNLTGNPAMSVPAGFFRDGMPIGMQIIGRPREEAMVVRVGHAFQALTDWHTRRPVRSQRMATPGNV